MEQLVWRRVSVFAGTFGLDAAEGVCSIDLDPNELLDALTVLVEKSILIREEFDASVRFRILDTLREYGYDKLKHTNEYLALRRRHRDWYESLALDAEAEWISAHQLDWIARLKREQPNLREALDFGIDDDPAASIRSASALYWFWSSQGSYNEGRSWLERTLLRQSGPPTFAWIMALYGDSVMANVQGDFEVSGRLVQEARTLAAQSKDPMLHALVACAEGMRAVYGGDLSRASSHLESAAAEFSRNGKRTLEIAALHPLGLAFALSGQTEQAIDLLERVLAITAQHSELMYRSHSLWALGIAVWRNGNNERATRVLEQALELTRQVKGPRVAASCLEALAWIACSLGDAVRAATLLGASEGLARSVGSILVLYSDLVVYHEDCERKSRYILGDRRFEAARVKGTNFGFDAAIAYALHRQEARTSAVGANASTQLTKREREIAVLVADGLTNRAIADRLVISIRTVQGHVEHILSKLDLTSRTQVARWVVEQNFTH